MHDISALGVFEESLFLKIEKFSVLRNRLGERLRGCDIGRARLKPLLYPSSCMRR